MAITNIRWHDSELLLAAGGSCASTDHRKEWIRRRTSFFISRMVVIDSGWSVPCPEMIFLLSFDEDVRGCRRVCN
jgi:hypothetical protein